MARNPFYAGPRSDHFDGERFFFPGHHTDKAFLDLIRFARGAREPWPPFTANASEDRPPQRVEGPGLRMSFVGHASWLLQTAGLNLLLDPVWSERVSPVSFAGPKRVNPPGIAFDALPPIDAVLVTHGHYDHLDLATLSRLAAQGAPRVITPLGNDTIMRRHDPAIRAEAYDWGDRVDLGSGVKVTLEPTLHWSARSPFDRRMQLWCGFVIETPHGTIYHIGDTAYGDGRLFPRIKERYGAPRLAIIPIGAYEPRGFMRDQHVDPDEAVRIFEACGAEHAVAQHWGTFRLTYEAQNDPPRRLGAALDARAIPADRFRVLRPGQVFDVP